MQVLKPKPTGGIVTDGRGILQSSKAPDDLNGIRPQDTITDDQADDKRADYSSGPGSSNFDSRSPQSSATSSVPPRAEEWDRTLRHTRLSDFGKVLENAARAIYPNDKGPRYSRVYVLLISWRTEDPKLPVGREISALREVLEDIYHYDVQEFHIPDSASHAAVSEKINAFVKVNGDSSNDLKIAYYAGHSLLSRNKELIWSTLSEKTNTKAPKVVWSGIQRSLEMAQSDILILLDCCWSGVANDTEGSGITELICACPFDSRANGVGHYSFTRALTTELRLLSKSPCFSVGKLYTAIYTRMQSYLMQGIDNERYPPPVHFVLSQDEPLVKAIQLSVRDPMVSGLPGIGSSKSVCFDHEGSRKRTRECDSTHVPNKRPALDKSSNSRTEDGSIQGKDESKDQSSQGLKSSDQKEYINNEVPNSISKDSLYPLDAPRALFAVRFREDIRAEDLSIKLFQEWLRSIPAAAEEVRIEASFKCSSTLLLITAPLSMSSYIPQHPAIFTLGTVKSSIVLPLNERNARLITREEDVNSASRMSADTRLLALASLPSVESKDDPPRFPLAHYDGPVITDKRKEKMKNCMHIIVVGCGLAGLTASIAFAKGGHQVTIVESAPCITYIGAGIQVSPNSSRVLRKLGVDKYIEKYCTEPVDLRMMRWRDGKILVECPLKEPAHTQYGSPYWDIHRGDLHRGLLECAMDLGCKMFLDSRVISIDPYTPFLVTKAGRTYSGDLIVASDGLHSMAREVVLGRPGPPIPTGQMVYRVTIPVKTLKGIPELAEIITVPRNNHWLGPNGTVLSYLLEGANDTLINFVFTCDVQMPEGINQRPGKMADVRKRFSEWDPRVVRILEHVGEVLEWRLFTHEDIPKWVHDSGKMCLIGDAAHAMTPYLAQGAGMGIEDAAILGGLLAKYPHRETLGKILRLYEKIRIERAQKVAHASIGSRWFTQMPDGPKQQERDDWLVAHPGIQSNHWNIQSDREFLDWLFGYDAYKTLEEIS